MENTNKQHLKLQDVLAHCSHKTKRIKKLTRNASIFSKQSKIHGEKVQYLANEAAAAISTDMSNCPDSQDNSMLSQPTMEMPSTLQEIFSNFPKDEEEKMDPQCSTPVTTEIATFSNEWRLPVLPTSFDCSSYDDMCNDDVSDSESDFFPDWSSSSDSCSSSMTSRAGRSRTRFGRKNNDEIFLNDEDLLKLSDDYLDFPADELDDCMIPMEQEKSISEDKFGKSECSFIVSQLPIPACGNEIPGSSSPLPEKAPASYLSPTDNNTMKPHALRRVKSMVIENDLEDGVEVGKRMYVVQQKQTMTSMTSQPSPLLSSNEITSLRKTPSQTSTGAKYTLKRSRSTISAELAYSKRNDISGLEERNEIIIEESEFDQFDERN